MTFTKRINIVKLRPNTNGAKHNTSVVLKHDIFGIHFNNGKFIFIIKLF